jgi:hypothetical protein
LCLYTTVHLNLLSVTFYELQCASDGEGEREEVGKEGRTGGREGRKDDLKQIFTKANP